MVLFYVGCKVVNPAETSKSATIPRLMVDTGAEATWIDGAALERAGISHLAEGQKVSFNVEQDSRSGKISANNLQIE